MKDLVVLVADKNMHYAIRGALARNDALGVRKFSFDFRMHPGRDGGVRTTGPDVLAGESRRFQRALVIVDHDGCGKENESSLSLEATLDCRLNTTWGDRAKAIVISPEVDVWLWGNDNVLAEVFEWPLPGTIRDWLAHKDFLFDDKNKPLKPKEALEALQSVHKKARSSALYERVTSKLSLAKCTDTSFVRLRTQLQSWFPAE